MKIARTKRMATALLWDHLRGQKRIKQFCPALEQWDSAVAYIVQVLPRHRRATPDKPVPGRYLRKESCCAKRATKIAGMRFNCRYRPHCILWLPIIWLFGWVALRSRENS